MRAHTSTVAIVVTLALIFAAGCDPTNSDEPIDPAELPCVPGRAPAVDATKPYCHELELEVLTHEPSTPLFVTEPDSGVPRRISPSIHGVAPGDNLEIMGGFQGLHMVVLGFRTAAVTHGNLRVKATIDSTRGVLASREWSKRGVNDGGDGFGYGLDLFLVVDDVSWRDWVDEPATLTLVVSTTEGLLIGRAVLQVTMRSSS
ncbi:MAG: hypothetical protein R3F39_04515 [Myxococcota bacterium]